MPAWRAARWAVPAVSAVLAACTGSGQGLDQNGLPAGSGGSTQLTADLQSIQDNVFTPICTRCHIGASAPEGLQLDEAHSYALLVGVSSAEDPSLLRVKAGDPDDSYLLRKLQGGPDIVGAQMPFGGPYLPQSTIDVIRAWIANGAMNTPAMAARAMSAARRTFEVATTAPQDGAVVASAQQIVVSFNHELDAALVNYTTVTLERVAGDEILRAQAPPLPASLRLADGNPATMLITPTAALTPGQYRLTLRGTGGGALADVNGVAMAADYAFTFTVAADR